MFWIGLVVGAVFGACIGVIVAAGVILAAQADRLSARLAGKTDKRHGV